MIVYTYNQTDQHPIPIECETPGWPNLDADGNQMFNNTHFATEQEAWGALLRDREAGLSLATRELRTLQERLRNVTERTAEAGCQLIAAREAHERWREERHPEPERSEPTNDSAPG